MRDELTLTLNSPITEEQWDAITDVDFEHTDRIWFETKHGKTVEFVKKTTMPRWIPCSERLPEVGQDILMSIGGMYTAEGCLREDGDWAQFRWNSIQRKDMVGAWMPLPEPFKEGEK